MNNILLLEDLPEIRAWMKSLVLQVFPHSLISEAARVHDALVADHRMSMLLIRALKHRKGARAAVRIAGATPWTRRNFARWLFEDYPRSLVTTPRRWRRGMFTGPGAYR